MNDVLDKNDKMIVREMDFLISPNKTKDFQVDELIKLKVVSDRMMKKWLETDELDDKFHQISRNIINLTDKMRRQDEGIKVHQDLSVTQDEFRRIVDTEFKIVEAETKKNDL